MFALLLPILLVIGGGAIDFSRLYETKAQLQNSADTAVLAAASYSGAGLAERTRRADGLFLNNTDLGSRVATHTLAVDGNEYVYRVSATVKTPFLNLIKLGSFDLDVEARALDDSVILDVALVLDISGSMGQGTQRLAEMKKAVKNFLAEFDPKIHDIKVAIVPFSGQVRVDPNTVPSSAFDYNLNPYRTTDCYKIADPHDRIVCERDSYARVPFEECYAFQDNAALRAMCGRDKDGFRLRPDFYRNETYGNFSYNSRNYQFHAFMLNGERLIDYRDCTGSCQPWSRIFKRTMPALDPVLSNTLPYYQSQPWSGCVIDRTQPFDTTADAATSSDKRTLYPKANCEVADQSTVLPLTDRLDMADAFAQSLKANGATDMTIGMQWGMEALSPQAPLTGSREKAKKIIIVLSDGENSYTRFDNRGMPGGADRMAQRTLEACNSAKKNGATVYTVNLIGGLEAALKACANAGPSYYQAVSKAQELTVVFSNIARDLKNIRLSF